VLDVGCGGGAFGTALKAAWPCEVVGVTYSQAEAAVAGQALDHVEVVDLNLAELATLGRFDCVVCSHVLEHLVDPLQVLGRLQACLCPGGTLVVALPNILFWKQRAQFMRGRFRYAEGGLMDRTHLRFYDWNTAAQLLVDAGYQVRTRSADGVFPLASRLGATLGSACNRAALRRWPGFFGVQFVLTAGVA
jgi:2-polyprenyl-3-methyl-5-hydroxy-6-metoxy-1,4-benzoquinol methylase